MSVLTIYRAGLLLLPPSFRRRFGRALLEEAEDRLREAGSGAGRITALGRLAVDLLGTVAREWWDVVVERMRGGVGAGTMADVRWVLRGLRRAPGFTLAVVAMLGLGIGVSTVAVGLVDAYLVKSLPYPDGDRLVALWPEENWSNLMVDVAREGLHSVEGLAATGGELLVLQEGGEPEEVFAVMATTNLFDVIGVKPVLGRGFLSDDGVPGAAPVTILSHRVWVERFGSDPSVIGRSIALGGGGELRRTVVGVMPGGYIPLDGRGVAAWVPVIVDRSAEGYGDEYNLKAMGRLAPGLTPDDALREMRSWAPHMSEADPGWFTPERIARASALPLGAYITGDRRTPVLLALSAALLVLLVACGNAANLMVARTLGRERELSVRAALGAGRLRTACTLLLEVAALGVAATVVGFGAALALVRVLESRLPEALPEWGLTLNPRWGLAAGALALLAVLLSGLVPALQASRRDPARAMAGGRGAMGSRRLIRLQELLSASQLALATAGVAAMGLLGQSLWRLDQVDPGFAPGSAMTFRVTAPPVAYPDDADVLRFFRDARTALAHVPGVEVAGFGSRLPLSGGQSEVTVQPEGMRFDEDSPRPVAWHRLVTPGYLQALGAHLVDGRLPTEADDRDGDPELVVINRAAAQAYWPGASPIGKRFYGPGHSVWLTVVGVVDNVLEKGQGAPAKPALYIPHRDWARRSMYAVVRTREPPSALLPQMKQAIWSVSAGTPISQVRTLEQVLDSGLRPTRTLAILAALAGGVTLLLGALGTYGVIGHGVTRRLREIGVRAALGADRSRLLRGELARATRIVAGGTVGGLALAFVTGRALRGVLFRVGALDLAPFVAAIMLLALVGYLAAYLPARRAARVDPVRIMREE
jgi:putative ABC transport system permease protein